MPSQHSSNKKMCKTVLFNSKFLTSPRIIGVYNNLIIQDEIKAPENIRLKLFHNIQKLLTHPRPIFSFNNPGKQKTTIGSLVFSVGIKWKHWPKMR